MIVCVRKQFVRELRRSVERQVADFGTNPRIQIEPVDRGSHITLRIKVFSLFGTSDPMRAYSSDVFTKGYRALDCTLNELDAMSVDELEPETEIMPTLDSSDILRGADAIAEFLFGDKRQVRKVYHLAATGGIPSFKLGAIVCVRKSTLLKWIEQQEKESGGLTSSRSVADAPVEPVVEEVVLNDPFSKFVVKTEEGTQIFDTESEAKKYLKDKGAGTLYAPTHTMGLIPRTEKHSRAPYGSKKDTSS